MLKKWEGDLIQYPKDKRYFQRLQKLFVLKILIKMKELVTLVKKIHKKFCSPIYVKLKRH